MPAVVLGPLLSIQSQKGLKAPPPHKQHHHTKCADNNLLLLIRNHFPGVAFPGSLLVTGTDEPGL